MGDIRECYAEWLKEFISSLTVHREHKSAECFSPCFLLPVLSLLPGLQSPCKIRSLGWGWLGGGWGGRELPTPTVLATCLENIQIACVICKPLSHPGGSYISCHYPGGPPIIVSCNNQLQCFIPQARQARSAFFFFFFLRCTLPHYFSLTKE